MRSHQRHHLLLLDLFVKGYMCKLNCIVTIGISTDTFTDSKKPPKICMVSAMYSSVFRASDGLDGELSKGFVLKLC